MTLRTLAVLALAGLALTGLTACAQVAGIFGKLQPPCTIEEDRPARLFAIDAPETAKAGETFSVVVWTSLEGDLKDFVTPLPGTYQADVDAAAKTLTLSGKVRADVPNPEADCLFAMGMPAPKGSTMSIEVSAPAGNYTLTIPEAVFERQKPMSSPYVGAPMPFDYPEPVATRSITIQ
jgi:hypothetical protein